MPSHQLFFGQCGFERSILLYPNKGYISAFIRGDKIPIYFFDHWVELLSLVFPKILKSVYAMLCRKGHISTAYIDDSCFQWHTKQHCTQNVSGIVHLLENFGFTVHGKKFVLKANIASQGKLIFAT